MPLNYQTNICQEIKFLRAVNRKCFISQYKKQVECMREKHGSCLIFLMVEGSSATLDRLQIVALIRDCSLFIDEDRLIR